MAKYQTVLSVPMRRHKSRCSHVNVSYAIMEENAKQRSSRKRARREAVKDNKK